MFKHTSDRNIRVELESTKRCERLLAIIHDGFTPVEAMAIWNMTRAKVDITTALMRDKRMIEASGGHRNRIFLKVKENADQIS